MTISPVDHMAIWADTLDKGACEQIATYLENTATHMKDWQCENAAPIDEQVVRSDFADDCRQAAYYLRRVLERQSEGA